MASRSARIITLLVIDSLFFFLEIIVGSYVHSLALVADSFHMLNDVFSLVVALYAIRLAKSKATSSKYTYGWQRAEVLGALVNGVFLLALCLSIFLEAIQRFFDPPEITQPKLVLGVGIAGLVSNILGLFLFHEHGHGGHSHGDDGHATHKHTHGQEGHIHADGETDPSNESGDIESVLPQTVVGMYPTESQRNGKHHHSRSFGSSSRHRHLGDIHVHPAQNRQAINDAANSEFDTSDSDDEAVLSTETTGLLNGKRKASGTKHKTSHIHTEPHTHPHKHNHTENLLNPVEDGSWHKDHIHNKPKADKKKGGHSHQNLNMRGVFLHVLGDALGNVGVIGSALIIWLSDWKYRFYSDPIISLIITGIIFTSALPLCKSASKILLQAVPNGIDVEDVKRDIRNVPGVLSVHELHIWQLSDVKLVASLHVQIAFNPHGSSDSHDNKADPTAQYIALSQAIRTCLHAYGIHSSTIQPEYNPASSTPVPGMASPPAGGSAYGSFGPGSKAGSDVGGDAQADVNSCLMECADECATGKCCGPVADLKEDSHAGHNH